MSPKLTKQQIDKEITKEQKDKANKELAKRLFNKNKHVKK